MSTGIIILAAGNSSRLGSPKQLLSFMGCTLLETIVSAATRTSFAPIVLVLGAYAEDILIANPKLNVNYVINQSWEHGMSSSIVAGLKKIIELEPSIENVIITVADQPFITTAVLEALLENLENTGKNIIASKYAHTLGTPVLFNKKYFGQLMSLEGNSGAKQLLNLYPDDVSAIRFDLGHIDIDTETDFKNLTEKQ